MKIRLAVALAASLAPGLAFAVQTNTFIASCTPSQETAAPTVTGTPSCVATFVLEPAPGRLSYKVRCNHISGVTAAHIHNGNADTASGGINQFLFSGGPTGDVEGILTSGEFLRATLGDTAFDSLVAAMRSDNVYVNVHTSTNGGGEVRGQVVPLVVPAVRTLNY